MNGRFLQLHVLTSYGPANLNRDDLGQPKTALLGGVNRLRISSQCLKRTWRDSDEFTKAIEQENIGKRSKRFFLDFFRQHAAEKNVSAKDWAQWVAPFSKQFGDFESAGAGKEKENAGSVPKEQRPMLLKTMVFLSNAEHEALNRILERLMRERRAAEKKDLVVFAREAQSADVALFGRMLANAPTDSIDAAAQVAHAITVHACEAEDDYFTAVDDLNRREETGSAHLGEAGFGAGVFYLYACINRELLLENLSGDAALAARTLQAFVECMTRVAPRGKQSSHASRAAASYALAELGDEQPRQLTAAFVEPVKGGNVIEVAIQRLEKLLEGFDAVYGTGTRRFGFDVAKAGVAASATEDATALAGPNVAAKLAAFAASGLE